jgi:hypothetical protein
MNRRTFLFGALSTATALLIPDKRARKLFVVEKPKPEYVMSYDPSTRVAFFIDGPLAGQKRAFHGGLPSAIDTPVLADRAEGFSYEQPEPDAFTLANPVNGRIQRFTYTRVWRNLYMPKDACNWPQAFREGHRLSGQDDRQM